MFTLPVSCWRSDSGVSKRKKKRGEQILLLLLLCCFLLRAPHYLNSGTGYAGRERVQLIALVLFSPQIATLASITTI